MKSVCVFLIFFVFASVSLDGFELIERQNLATLQIRAVIPKGSRQVSLQEVGRDIVVVFSGLVGRETAIYFRRFDVSLKSWTEPERVSPPRYGDDRSPSLWVDSKGTIHCVWLSLAEEKQYEVCYSRRGTENSSSWSSPVKFPAGMLANAATLKGSGERLCLYYWNRPRSEWGRIFLYVSDDCGNSWRPSDPGFPSPGKKGEASQPQLVFGSKSQIYMVWLDQTPGGRAVVFNASADHAKNWFSNPVVMNSQLHYAMSDPQLYATAGILHVVWKIFFVDTPHDRTEIWTDHSYNEGKSWVGNHLVYSGPVTDVAALPFQFGDKIGCLWSEVSADKVAAIKYRLFWDKSSYLNDAQVSTLMALPRGLFFEGLSFLSDGKKCLGVTSQQGWGSQEGRALVFYSGEAEPEWHHFPLSERKTGIDATDTVGIENSDGSYSILYHEIRKKQFPMQPAIWDTDLVFNRIKISF